MHHRLTVTATAFAGLVLLTSWFTHAAFDEQVLPALEQVGPTADGGWFMPTGHKVRSAGQTVAFAGRPVALLLGKDGSMLWVRETANAVVLKNRQVLLVVCEDITEQKRAEEDQKKMKAIYDTVTPEALWKGKFVMPLKGVSTGGNFGRRRVLIDHSIEAAGGSLSLLL